MIGIGINCTHPKYISSLLEELNTCLPSNTQLPRVIYPNSGEEWEAGTGYETV